MAKKEKVAPVSPPTTAPASARETLRPEECMTMAPVQNAKIVAKWANGFGTGDLSELAGELNRSAKAVSGGDMKPVELMLYGQAVALQALFTDLTDRAARAEYLAHMESFMRLGLKAQSQCARTLEILAAVRNPPVIFAKQANVTTGPQQVNNAARSFQDSTHAGAGNSENRTNELLEAR